MLKPLLNRVFTMGTWEMHHNEEYWPDFFKFDPDRWTNPPNAKRLDKAYVPFSKGSRMCIGIK
jgi:cytochrome P450